MFIRSLRHKYVRYGLKTTRDILDHLYATYANISSVDLQENNAIFCTPYDINEPIESLFNRVKTAVITPPPATLPTASNKSSASLSSSSIRPVYL